MIGILLAGGRASRIGGGDKGRHRVGGRPILDRVVATMRAQCDALVVNANGDPRRFAALDLPIVADTMPDQPGPLAGVLAGLDHVAAHHPGSPFAVTVPTDAPFLPGDLVARLLAPVVRDPSIRIVGAMSGGRPHYVTALWDVALRHHLRLMLAGDDRRVSGVYARHRHAMVDWPVTAYDPFFNVNTPQELAQAEAIAARFPPD